MALVTVPLVSGLATVLLVRAVGRGAHRRSDEQGLPLRRGWWAAPVVVLAVAALVWLVPGRTALWTTGAAAFTWMAVLALVDVDVRRLPDVWTLPAWPVAAALLAWCSLEAADGVRWWAAVGCGLATGVVMLLLALGNPAGLGTGDVKLSLTLGMLTGWFGWPYAVTSVLLGLVLGLLVGVVAAVRSGHGRRTTFPLGPSLMAGAALVVLLGAAGLGPPP